MNERPQACLEALAAIESDPLVLPPAVETHIRTCTSCSEARVNWLAMEEVPPALAPAGYFEHLPDRILRKLPVRPRLRERKPFLWAVAAGLLMSVAGGGFWMGRANRPAVSEATRTAPAPSVEAPAVLPEDPFREGEDEMTQVHELTPEQAQALIDRLDPKGKKQ